MGCGGSKPESGGSEKDQAAKAIQGAAVAYITKKQDADELQKLRPEKSAPACAQASDVAGSLFGSLFSSGKAVPQGDEAATVVRRSSAKDRWLKAGEQVRAQSMSFYKATKEAQLQEAAVLAAQVSFMDKRDPLVCTSSAPGAFDTKVIGLCGMSCSGKSTVTAVIKANAEEQGCLVPVICLDDSFSEWMFDDCATSTREHPECVLTPPHVAGRRCWKNWEAKHCIDWPTFRKVLEGELARHRGKVPYIIVEGFLLLEDDEACAMLDHVICIGVSKDVAWQRRLSRALSMAAGAKDASGMDNYEVLPTNAVEEHHAAVHDDARAEVGTIGTDRVYPRASDAHAKTTDDALAGAKVTYDWLRLYFEEVIWPFAESVAQRVDAQVGADQRLHVHKIDGDASIEDVSRAARNIMSEATFAA